MKIFILIVIIIVLFILFMGAALNKVFSNPYTIHMTIGKPGSGKSTLMVKRIIRSIKRGRRVLVNEEEIAKRLNVEYMPIERLASCRYENCDVYIDEAGIDVDNRAWKTQSKELAAWFKLHRHFKNNVYLFSQSYDIDKKIRDCCAHFSIVKQKFGVFIFEQRIDIIVRLIEADSFSKEGYIVDDLVKRKLISGGLSIHFMPRYWKLYDSWDTSRLESNSTSESNPPSSSPCED